MAEDAFDDVGLGEEGEDAQRAVAAGTAQGVELVDPGPELGPADAGGGGGAGGVVGAVTGGRSCGTLEVIEPAEFVVRSPVANHLGAEVSVGREHTVIAVAVGPRRRDEAREPPELHGGSTPAQPAFGRGSGDSPTAAAHRQAAAFALAARPEVAGRSGTGSSTAQDPSNGSHAVASE